MDLKQFPDWTFYLWESTLRFWSLVTQGLPNSLEVVLYAWNLHFFLTKPGRTWNPRGKQENAVCEYHSKTSEVTESLVWTLSHCLVSAKTPSKQWKWFVSDQPQWYKSNYKSVMTNVPKYKAALCGQIYCCGFLRGPYWLLSAWDRKGYIFTSIYYQHRRDSRQRNVLVDISKSFLIQLNQSCTLLPFLIRNLTSHSCYTITDIFTWGKDHLPGDLHVVILSTFQS